MGTDKILPVPPLRALLAALARALASALGVRRTRTELPERITFALDDREHAHTCLVHCLLPPF